MQNTTMFQYLINEYQNLAFTNNYIFGYTVKGVVYASFCTHEDLPYLTKLDKSASNRNEGYSIRFSPTKIQKEFLRTKETFALCSKEFFEGVKRNSKYNRGEIFEKLITEHFHQQWKKDNVPFTESGDIVVDGIHYQIKFQRATFCNEKSVQHLKAKRG